MLVLDMIPIICKWLLNPPNDIIIVENKTFISKDKLVFASKFNPCVISNIELIKVLLILKLVVTMFISNENSVITPNTNNKVFPSCVKKFVSFK